jgi:hypothetical protein
VVPPSLNLLWIFLIRPGSGEVLFTDPGRRADHSKVIPLSLGAIDSRATHVILLAESKVMLSRTRGQVRLRAVCQSCKAVSHPLFSEGLLPPLVGYTCPTAAADPAGHRLSIYCLDLGGVVFTCKFAMVLLPDTFSSSFPCPA